MTEQSPANAQDLPKPSAVVIAHEAGESGITEVRKYDVSRKAWRAGEDARNVPQLPIFVVAKNDDAYIIHAVYRAESWDLYTARKDTNSHDFYQFNGAPDPILESEYVGKRLESTQLGKDRFPQHGWVPNL